MVDAQVIAGELMLRSMRGQACAIFSNVAEVQACDSFAFCKGRA